MAAVYNTRLLFHISRACCLFACNDFGQHNPSLFKHATMSTAQAMHTRHVPMYMPHPCPCTTNIFKHWHMGLTDDTQHTRLKHKACIMALASSMPMHHRYNKVKYIIENLSPFTHATKAATDVDYTRHVPRHVPHPYPCTTSIIKSST